MTILIIGGGLVGLGTALALKRHHPGVEVCLLEKEACLGYHQSTHNSGVLHAGLYYPPGSLKAKLAVNGIRRMVTFCREHGVAHDICGKLVIATTENEVGRLRTLVARGIRNGLQGLRWINGDQLAEIEPHAVGLAAVHVPEEGIVDFRGVCDAMQRLLSSQGVRLITGARVLRIRRLDSEWRLETSAGEFAGDFLINCAGLHCDRIAAAAGELRESRIVPFRGEYYRLRPQAQHLVRNLIYPVPDPNFPFLGVHFTRMIHGGIEAGPNAVLALSREGYRKANIRLSDVADALGYSGLWNFMRRHRRMAWDEVRRSFDKELFCQSLQKLVPDLRTYDLEHGGSGVRAQAMMPDGTLVQDFHFLEREHALHVLNAPSPGATASLEIGDYVARKALNIAGTASTAHPISAPTASA